jgi:hypothetical protein
MTAVDPYHHHVRPCSVPGCTRTVLNADYCAAHAMRLARTGELGPPAIGPYRQSVNPCADCGERAAHVRGLCQRCYMRQRRAGEPR